MVFQKTETKKIIVNKVLIGDHRQKLGRKWNGIPIFVEKTALENQLELLKLFLPELLVEHFEITQN